MEQLNVPLPFVFPADWQLEPEAWSTQIRSLGQYYGWRCVLYLEYTKCVLDFHSFYDLSSWWCSRPRPIHFSYVSNSNIPPFCFHRSQNSFDKGLFPVIYYLVSHEKCLILWIGTINAWFFPFVYPVLKEVNWVLFHPQKVPHWLFFYYYYKPTDLNIFDEFQSIAVFIEAEIVPSLANRRLFKFTPDSFSRDTSGLC